MKRSERMEVNDRIRGQLVAYIWQDMTYEERRGGYTSHADTPVCIYCGSFLTQRTSKPCWRQACRILASLENRVWGSPDVPHDPEEIETDA